MDILHQPSIHWNWLRFRGSLPKAELHPDIPKIKASECGLYRHCSIRREHDVVPHPSDLGRSYV